MTYSKFNSILQDLKLSKKAFAEEVGMTYTGVTNWKQVDSVPAWVKSWLENYIKSQKFDKIKDILKDEMG